MTATAQSKPRKKQAPKPDAPCAKINGRWVLLTDLLKWRTAWPTIKCGGCPRPAFGLFAITIYRGIPADQRTAFRTLCSRCALGNKLDPRKRPWIKMVFEITPDPLYLESELLINEALGIGRPHEDPAGKFILLREQSAEDPANRTRSIVAVFDAPSAHAGMDFARTTYGHVHNHCLRLNRIVPAQAAPQP